MRFYQICLVVFAVLLSADSLFAQAAPRNGDRFGDWIFNCQALGPSETLCALTQELTLKSQGKRLLRVTLGPIGPNTETVLQVLAPLGVYIPAGVAFKVDKGPLTQMQMQSCTAQGCKATLPADKDLLWALKAGSKMMVGFKAGAASKTLSVPVSLKGIQDGMAAVGEE